MSNYCFYAPDAQGLVEKAKLKEMIDEFSNSNQKQTYVLRKPLAKDDAPYENDDAIVIFSAGMQPCFVGLNNDQKTLEDYADDFLEDLSFLSEKFKYREKIGRRKNWQHLFNYRIKDNFSFDGLEPESITDKRVIDLITSLVVGSINNVAKIDLNATHLLDVVKSKIIIFDTDQTGFVFRGNANKRLVIQGLAGSGKTELLLHKMKEIYSRDNEARIAFTCYNKILASSMRQRIPEFFDFMRVERQIEWDKKLFCFHSWGSGSAPISGMYRYICHFYNISFGSLRAGSFDHLCKKAISEIKNKGAEASKAFDYVFIDESQDFDESFIELCELVTAKKVFVAGDVFQNIFRPIDDSVKKADMVLKKCYRTDPTNLMFAHSLGMGLFEQPVLRWLKPDEWDACGYSYHEKDERAILSRDPLRRFEDIPADFKSTHFHTDSDIRKIQDTVLQLVKDILDRHPTAKQGDFAVIFLDKDSYIYDVISNLKAMISQTFGWNINVSFETKETHPDKFFISNVNNAKGLEFPFVICVSLNLNRNPSVRNALYTMMARSFLESHLLTTSYAQAATTKPIREGLNSLYEHGHLNVRIPSDSEIAEQKDFLILETQPTVEEIVRRFFEGKKVSTRKIEQMLARINSITQNNDYDEDYIMGLADLEYRRINNP